LLAELDGEDQEEDQLAKLEEQIEALKVKCITANKAGDKPTALKFLKEKKELERQLAEL
jgi:phage shock protein A